METGNSNLTIFDIYTASFLALKGYTPALVMEDRRVLFSFPDDPRVRDLIHSFSDNPSIPIQNYVHCLKKLRGQMLSRRGL